jgi:hypothetical protein
LDVKENLQKHFENLAQKYNLTAFENRMRGFIDIAHKSIDQPAMNKVILANLAIMGNSIIDFCD